MVSIFYLLQDEISISFISIYSFSQVSHHDGYTPRWFRLCAWQPLGTAPVAGPRLPPVQPEDIGGDKPGLRNPAPCRVTDTIGIPEWNTVSIKTDYNNEMFTNWCRISQPSTVCIWGHDHISAKLKSSASYGDDSPIHLPWFQWGHSAVPSIYPDHCTVYRICVYNICMYNRCIYNMCTQCANVHTTCLHDSPWFRDHVSF